MTQSSAHPSAAGDGAGTWDLGFVAVGSQVTAAVTVVAVPVVALTLGWPGVTGVLVGAAVVTAFFATSGVVVAWAGRTFGDQSTLPAALLLFGVKMLVLLALLQNLPADGWTDRVVVGWTAFVGVLLWSGVQMRWVWTRKLFYSPPPAPPGGAG